MQSDKNLFKFSTITLALPLYFVLFMWLVFWFETKFGYNFAKYGLRPRSLAGLKGLVLSPFIHSDFKHLFNNSAPLFVLLITLFYFYKKVAFKVLIYGSLLLGFITWLIGRDSLHIGASGIVYLLFGFTLFSGVFKKNYRLTAVSFMIIFLYGSMIWYIFPMNEKISWEGHLSGLITGLFFAIIYRKIGSKPQQFAWEKSDYVKDAFDLQFDEDGNYIPPKIEEIESNIKINYHNKSEEE
ncbi:MAG: rhomboid family intramembrane serine protease [Flavobacteriaceae bacterium]|nr:rhomboid family intramembrane serine protease [Flavobacteriaceae bacterium]